MRFAPRRRRRPFYRMSHGTAAPSERDWNAAIIARIDVPASQLPSLTQLFTGSNEPDLRRPLAAANDRNISAAELSIGAGDPKKYSSEQGVWDVCPARRQHFKPLHRCYKYRQFFKLPKTVCSPDFGGFFESEISPVCLENVPSDSLEYERTNRGPFEEKEPLAMGGS